MARKVVVFGISEDVPAGQHDDVLRAVRSVAGVVEADLLARSSGVAEVKRMGVAVVGEGAWPPRVANLIVALPGIEYATPPAARGTVRG